MSETSILLVAEIFKKSIQEVIARSCNLDVPAAKTAQIIPNVGISKEIGSFVSFDGDYSGLMVLNFEGEAALEIVTTSLKVMGMPAEDIPSHYLSDDVVNTIGELTNHIIGKARTTMQSTYDLTAHSNIPAVVPVTAPIGLVFKAATLDGNSCVRIVFRTPQNHHFHMEMTTEPSLFVPLLS
ncbi:MAG: DUF3334 family protein [SAR324 cluster bacterium]|nr:DUF3334 family protein [SAR324 cluster bacterium]